MGLLENQDLDKVKVSVCVCCVCIDCKSVVYSVASVVRELYSGINEFTCKRKEYLPLQRKLIRKGNLIGLKYQKVWGCDNYINAYGRRKRINIFLYIGKIPLIMVKFYNV